MQKFIDNRQHLTRIALINIQQQLRRRQQQLTNSQQQQLTNSLHKKEQAILYQVKDAQRRHIHNHLTNSHLTLLIRHLTISTDGHLA